MSQSKQMHRGATLLATGLVVFLLIASQASAGLIVDMVVTGYKPAGGGAFVPVADGKNVVVHSPGDQLQLKFYARTTLLDPVADAFQKGSFNVVGTLPSPTTFAIAGSPIHTGAIPTTYTDPVYKAGLGGNAVAAINVQDINLDGFADLGSNAASSSVGSVYPKTETAGTYVTGWNAAGLGIELGGFVWQVDEVRPTGTGATKLDVTFTALASQAIWKEGTAPKLTTVSGGVVTNMFSGGPVNISTVEVPEPSTLVLFAGLGVAVVVGLRRRRR